MDQFEDVTGSDRRADDDGSDSAKRKGQFAEQKDNVGSNDAETGSFNSADKEVDELIIREKGMNKKLTRCGELELAAGYCRKRLRRMSLSGDGNSVEFVQFMEKLVQCEIELDALKEELADPVKRSRILRAVTFRGHRFSLQSATGRNPYCEVCLSTIWRLVQPYRRCDFCGLRSHDKCVESVVRYCAGAKAHSVLFRPRTEICEEHGLDEQNYSCAECHHALQFDGPTDCEPRLCDYNGHYYCPRCHWNDEWVIPARIVHNWDFSKYKVCRAAKQLLVIIEKRPLFSISKLNAQLLNYVDQLGRINKLRRNILLMKCYFLCCRTARKQRILLHLKHRQHFVENSDVYSLLDLVDLYQGRLLPEIEEIVQIFTEHITKNCLTCQGKGFVCELCDDTNVIYPFSDNVAICRDCLATFHQECFDRKSKRCPRCLRRRSRTSPVYPVESGP